MAYTLSQLYEDATGVGAYKSIVSAGCAYVAVQIIGENINTPSHAVRLGWAQKTLSDPESVGRKMLWGVLSNSTIYNALPNNVTDAMVISAVDALVVSYANA